jgi:hypothetical protein
VGDFLPHPIDPRHPLDDGKYIEQMRAGGITSSDISGRHISRGKKDMKGEWVPSFYYNSAEAGGLGKLSSSVIEPNAETSISFVASLPTARF